MRSIARPPSRHAGTRRPSPTRRRRARIAIALTAAGLMPAAGLIPIAGVSVALAPEASAAPVANTGNALSPIPNQRPPTDPVFRLAGGCYTLQVAPGRADGGHAGAFVDRAGAGYATTTDAAAAEPFRTKAAQLGRFLLYGTDATMLTAAGPADPLADAVGSRAPDSAPAAVVASPDPGAGSDWRVDYDDDGTYGLANTVTGRRAVVDAATGTFTTAGPDAAGVRFRLAAAEGCATFPESEVGAHGTPHSGTADGTVTGYADPHVHMATDGYIGGEVHCGRPVSPLGITAALADCPDHKPDGVPALLENIISNSTPVATHDTTGWPTFAGYPEAHSLTHEQTYYRWVERAWRGGLRIMSDLLVTNDVLCDIYWLGDTPCDGMAVARKQMRELHEIQDYIDAQYGGPGRGWFRLAESPAAARKVIESGRLAVVPGIEISDIAGCTLTDDTPDCSAADIDRGLDELDAMGVRQVILVHKFDNALGGTRMDTGFNGVAVNIGNLLASGHFWEVEPCTGAATDNAQPLTAPGAEDVTGMLPQGVTLPVYPEGPTCNTRGLTDLGEHAVRGLTERGMIVDVDHMGAKAADETLDILEQAHYPHVISSHSWTDPHNYPRILELGGFVSLMANGSPDYVDRWQSLRADAPADRLFGLGYSSDVNGFAAQVPPPDEGAGDTADGRHVHYPYTTPDGTVMDRQRTGDRVFDFRRDGVAQYGLYPDWIEDTRLRAGPGGDRLMTDMGHGAEAYLRMWEGR